MPPRGWNSPCPRKRWLRYCLLNDLAIVSLEMRKRGVDRIVIIDADVHQGDGTARILQDESHIITCSIHNQKNFPLRKAVSDYDVGLENNLGDDAYLAVFRSMVDDVISHHKPDLVIYDAGVDVHKDDRLGNLSLSDEGVLARDIFVLDYCKQRTIPCATVIGGGYDRDIAALARRHLIVVQAACEIWQPDVLEKQ